MQLETQADLANAAADVTASLQRTRQVMVEVAALLVPCRQDLNQFCMTYFKGIRSL